MLKPQETQVGGFHGDDQRGLIREAGAEGETEQDGD